MSYDVFLSHTHSDKAWTRGLHDDLTSTDYRGRPLRAWLDEQVLAAATAISTGYDDLDGPVYFTRELADLAPDPASGATVEPPSLSLARLLPEPRPVPVPARIENGPLVGTVRKVTLANMEALADSLGPTGIACLTERRIVDALLDGASGFVIEEQQADEPLGRRLARRNSRFATYDGAVLQTLGDGDALVLLPGLDGKPASGFTASPV